LNAAIADASPLSEEAHAHGSAADIRGYLKMPFGPNERLSRPRFVAKSLTEFRAAAEAAMARRRPTMLGFHASPGREIHLVRFQKHF
jgi:hypothetical protein